MINEWQRPAKTLGLLAGLLVLAACRLEAEFPVYARDLIDALESGKPVDISYDLLVPIPSAKECQKYTDEIGHIIMPFFRKADARGCFSKGIESFLKLRINTSIHPRKENFSLVEVGKQQKALKEPFAIYVMKGDEGAFCAGVTTEPDAINAMLAAIREKHGQAPTEFGFNFKFNNDLRASVSMLVRDVFVDGQPVVDAQIIRIARRDEKRIQPSNVREAALWRQGWADVLCLKAEKE